MTFHHGSTGVPRMPFSLPRRMAPTDALFWYAETALPIFRPIIGGLYVLDRHPSAAGIAAGCQAALALVPRLRQRVVEAPLHVGLPEWVDDPHFDAVYHMRHLSVPEPGTVRQLLDLTATVFATPLDRERPLWEAYWIDGLEGGRAAYFFKMHHALVDGVGSLALVNALTQRRRSTPRFDAAKGPASVTGASTPSRLPDVIRGNVVEIASLAWQTVGAPLRWIAAPTASATQAWRIARGLRGLLTDVSAPTVQDPLVRSTSGLSRRLDIMEVPLPRLDHIRKPLGVTINDLVLTVLAGTLGAYHRERHVHVGSLNCMVPMNLRGAGEHDTLGNRVGMFNIVLPVGERRPERRLALIAQQTHAAKADKRSAVYPFLMRTLTILPGAAFGWLARQSLGRVNVACTNIPGVPERRYMAGAEVQAIYPFASVVQGTPLVVALFSYAGAMNIGIDTDPEAIPDPHRIAELFHKGLDQMEALSARRLRAT
jgi:diacylglycerol O-acyltransferase / wax synthase